MGHFILMLSPSAMIKAPSQPPPYLAKRRRIPILQRALGFTCQCIIPQIEDEDNRRPSLSAEIWDLILQDDLGCLLFIMKSSPDCQS